MDARQRHRYDRARRNARIRRRRREQSETLREIVVRVGGSTRELARAFAEVGRKLAAAGPIFADAATRSAMARERERLRLLAVLRAIRDLEERGPTLRFVHTGAAAFASAAAYEREVAKIRSLVTRPIGPNAGELVAPEEA